MSKPRVLVIDNDTLVRKDLKKNLEDFGFQVEIVQGIGQALLNNAKRRARSFRPHVAIVDLRLMDDYDDGDRSGLNLLSKLNAARCIMYSSFLNAEVSSEVAKKYKDAGWVDKSGPPQRLLEVIRETARQSCAAYRELIISPSSLSEQIIPSLGLGKKLTLDIANDILALLFPESRQIFLETIEESVKTPETASRGHSVVLKVRPDDRIEPLVVKFAPQKNIREEFKNFKKYIDRNLSGQFCAKLEGDPVIFGDAGAVKYSFLSAPKGGMSNFRIFYAEHNAQSILKPLHHFFTETWGELYQKRSAPIKNTLYSLYNRSWHSRLERRLVKFPNHDREIYYSELLNSLLNPVSWVLRYKDKSLVPLSRKTITHGDLHGDNIFVDDSHAWAIDFERSGWGHILRDFVELELDIVSRLMSFDVSLLELLGLSVTLSEPKKSGDRYRLADKYIISAESKKAFDVILGLRKIAEQQTGFTDYREYYWGLLLDAVFVATLTPDDTQRSKTPHSEDIQRKRALVYGAVLCSRLANWNEKWPTEDLRKVKFGEMEKVTDIDKPSNKEIIA